MLLSLAGHSHAKFIKSATAPKLQPSSAAQINMQTKKKTNESYYPKWHEAFAEPTLPKESVHCIALCYSFTVQLPKIFLASSLKFPRGKSSVLATGHQRAC